MRYDRNAEVIAMRSTRKLLALILAITASYAHSQSTSNSETGAISGTITDINGAVIPKAVVSVEKLAGPHIQAIADERGHFAMEARPGDYTLKVSSPGFREHQESIHLLNATSIKEGIILQVSFCSPCVTVISISAPIEPLNASLKSTLPLNPVPPLKLPSTNSKSLTHSERVFQSPHARRFTIKTYVWPNRTHLRPHQH